MSTDTALRDSQTLPGGDICTDCTFFDHCTGCLCNGVLMYEDIQKECRWGTHTNLEEWINFPHSNIE